MFNLPIFEKIGSFFKNKIVLFSLIGLVALTLIFFAVKIFFFKGTKTADDKKAKPAVTMSAEDKKAAAKAEKERKEKEKKEKKEKEKQEKQEKKDKKTKKSKDDKKIDSGKVPVESNDNKQPAETKVKTGETTAPYEKDKEGKPSVIEGVGAIITKNPVQELTPKPSRKNKYIRKKVIPDIPVLMVMLQQSLEKDNEALLNEALKGLQASGEMVDVILKDKILENLENPTIRRNAVRGLFYLGTPETVPTLKTVIKVDPDESVRLTALFALDNMDPENFSDFFEEVSKNDPTEKVRQRAQDYLSTRNTDQ